MYCTNIFFFFHSFQQFKIRLIIKEETFPGLFLLPNMRSYSRNLLFFSNLIKQINNLRIYKQTFSKQYYNIFTGKQFLKIMKIQTLLLLLSVFSYVFTQSSSTCCERNQIIVSGEGTASAMPDIGVIGLGFQEKGLTTADAVKALSSKVNQAIAILRNNGIGSDDYQTGSLSVYAQYNYKDGKNEIVGQKASQTINVKVKRIDEKGQKIGKLIDALSLVQNIRINSVSFDINDKVPLQEKARAAAFKDAKIKAEEFAQFAGLKVGRVITIDDSERVQAPIRNYEGSGLRTFASAGKTTSVPIAEQDLTYRTKVTFNLQ